MRGRKSAPTHPEGPLPALGIATMSMHACNRAQWWFGGIMLKKRWWVWRVCGCCGGGVCHNRPVLGRSRQPGWPIRLLVESASIACNEQQHTRTAMGPRVVTKPRAPPASPPLHSPLRSCGQTVRVCAFCFLSSWAELLSCGQGEGKEELHSKRQREEERETIQHRADDVITVCATRTSPAGERRQRGGWVGAGGTGKTRRRHSSSVHDLLLHSDCHGEIGVVVVQDLLVVVLGPLVQLVVHLQPRRGRRGRE
jgi:hypothetical protein